MIKFTNKIVPASVLRVSKFNWDRNISDSSIADLAANIEETGNIHPITVRPVGKAGHMYEIIAGRRRYLAQKLLGLTKIEVRSAKLSDLDAEIFSYSENLKVERPDSTTWARGVKKLVDLFEKKYAVGTRKRTKKPAITKDLDSPGFREPASLNPPKGGRPTTSRQKAIKDVAKTTNTSTKTVRNAVKRAEDLIPSAVRALELKKITQKQADTLARLPRRKQQVELRHMVIDAREGSQDPVKTLTTTEIALVALTQLCRDASKMGKRIDAIMTMTKDKKLDRAPLLKVRGYRNLEAVRDTLTDLLEALED